MANYPEKLWQHLWSLSLISIHTHTHTFFHILRGFLVVEPMKLIPFLLYDVLLKIKTGPGKNSIIELHPRVVIDFLTLYII